MTFFSKDQLNLSTDYAGSRNDGQVNDTRLWMACHTEL